MSRLSTPVFELEDAGISFGRVAALRAIDLVVREGERVAVIGPSGSGKTTLFRLLAGVLRPDANGRAYADVWRERWDGLYRESYERRTRGR